MIYLAFASIIMMIIITIIATGDMGQREVMVSSGVFQ